MDTSKTHIKMTNPTLIIYTCPTCGGEINLTALPSIGKEFKVQCPRCKDTITIKIIISGG